MSDALWAGRSPRREGAGLVGPYEDSMIIRSGWYFSALVNQREMDARETVVRLPRISSSAVFIWPTSTQHLLFGMRGRADQMIHGEKDADMQPFRISLTAVRLLCFAS